MYVVKNKKLLTNPFDVDLYPYCHDGWQYAVDVVTEKRIACKYVRSACARYINDFHKAQKDDCSYYFNPERAEKYLRAVQKFHHVVGGKDIWGSTTIVYEPWQNWLWSNIRGFFLKETDTVRFRTIHVELPRGNAKSTMASQCSLYTLACDKPHGNKISCVATKREQARQVLDSARAMARAAPAYLKTTGVRVLANSVEHRASNSEIIALSSDAKSLDGRFDVLSICDELHAMERKVFDTVKSGMRKRKDSMLLCITTAGYNIEGVGYSQSCYAKKVALGDVEEDSFFAVVYTIDEGDDPLTDYALRKANPNYGVSVDGQTLLADARQAKISSQDLASFLIKNLNIWQSEALAYFKVEDFNKLTRDISLSDFKGCRCYVALDYARKFDLTGYSITFFDEASELFYTFNRAFLPRKTYDKANNTVYAEAVNDGSLVIVDTPTMSQKLFKQRLLDDIGDLEVAGILFDPWNLDSLAQELDAEYGYEMIEFRQNTQNYNPAMHELDALIREERIYHDGNTILRYCIANVTAVPDRNENVFPRKSDNDKKIDIAITLLMTIGEWTRAFYSDVSHFEHGHIF